MQDFNKVIGIGLPKTGTVSLSYALSLNNISSIHFGDSECDEIRQKMYNGIYKFDTFDKYRGVLNAFEMIFPQVDKEYPNSKFIYTIRDKEAWLVSIEKHWQRMMKNKSTKPMEIHHHLITFGTCLFNKDRFAFVYDMHSNMVTNYFKDRPNDLLTVDITKDKQYVQKLCAFLGVPIVNDNPVHYNKS